MKRSFYIRKIADSKIFLHWRFPLIIFWIIFSNLRRGLNGEQVTWSVVIILALFVCVTLHELGNFLTARRYNKPTKEITLSPIGGVTRLEKMPEKPLQELIVALAGSLVNFVIVIILISFLQLTEIPTDLSIITHVTADNFLLSLALVNIWLAVFNLIPAFPKAVELLLNGRTKVFW